MRLNWLKILLLVLAVGASHMVCAQRVIEYVAGMGTRDPNNSDVWILYNKVKAMHDGMTLYTDSASFDTKNNIFIAHRNVRINITDTTTLLGATAIYDGTTRIADVWGDTVTLIDGKTILKTDLLSYDRNSSTASYFHWGHTVHGSAILDSRKGYYHSDSRDIYLFDEVILYDSSSQLETDTLLYNTITSLAIFISPTNIYSDSSTIYSEDGTYNTDSHDAASFLATRLTNREKWLTADTLFFNDNTEYGEAFGNVTIVDTLNNVICKGNVGITNQSERLSFVTDSALIVFIDKGDSLFMHADTIWAYNNDRRQFEAAKAYRNVRVYRDDAQAVCDSLYYSAEDSTVSMYYNPVVWYEDYQCVADTIVCHFDSAGVDRVYLNGNVMAVEKVDSLKFNQVKGRNSIVYLLKSEPLYSDILGSARMVYYVLDEESVNGKIERRLVGINAGVGSDMRIYFKKRKPSRFVTIGTPDMKMYPPDQLPEEEKTLPGFEWKDNIRPHNRNEVFRRVTK
ncbi:MAG: hypothetical protein K5842_04865 [Bacteroidales bacterium]|nr:hypothetical protein [Bacteroidales bacterium]